MARIVKDPDVRQNEILDTAQMLFYTKGYEKTAVRDIIDEVGIAKGTFYHYFNSKAELLDALIVRLLDQSMLLLEPILADEHLTALEKLHSFFGQVSNLKMENETLIRTLLPIWYQDDNTLMREKTNLASQEMMIPMLCQIVQQGIQEGVFQVTYPTEIGGIVFQTLMAMGDTLVRLLLKTENRSAWETIQQKIDAYNDALANLLGAESDSIHLFNFEPFQHWFDKEDQRFTIKAQPLPNL
jgi:AcrR family transcriptional regulator